MLWAPGRDPVQSFPSVLSDVYAGKATLGLADTGHGWWLSGTDADSVPRLVSEKVTNVTTDAAVRAGYFTTNLGARVLHIGARFTLSPTSNPGGGAAVLIIWRSLYGSTGGVPDTGLHLPVSDTGWSLGCWEGQASAQYAGGGDTFAVPLATDGTTVHTLDAVIVDSTAYLSFPDASTAEITDARISSLAGAYAGFEVYQGDASIDTKAAFTEVWAET